MTLGAGLTCLSALAHYGLPLPDPVAEPHLAVPQNFDPSRRDGVPSRLHYQQHRPSAGGMATVAEALDCAGDCLDDEWHLVAVDAALNRGLITLGDVLRFRRTSRSRREFLLSYADARAEAPGETIVRVRLVRAGFKVRPQAHIEGAGRVDVEVEGLLVIQVDGYGPHSSKRAFTHDRQGARAVIKAGRPQLNYAASEVLGYYSANVVRDARVALEEWRSRDLARIDPSGPRILRITRDSIAQSPPGA